VEDAAGQEASDVVKAGVVKHGKSIVYQYLDVDTSIVSSF
jgi:hypothetical protein